MTKNGNEKEADESSIRSGGIKDFVSQTFMITHVIAAAASQNNVDEPLPFVNYSLFEDNYSMRALSIYQIEQIKTNFHKNHI